MKLALCSEIWYDTVHIRKKSLGEGTQKEWEFFFDFTKSFFVSVKTLRLIM